MHSGTVLDINRNIRFDLFRAFGIGGFVFGTLYALFYVLVGRNIDKKMQV